MAKRMTDTNKWRKPFIRGLEGPYKLFWFYLLDDCDHAGIWIVDMEVAEIRTGESLNIEEAKKIFKDRIYIFDNGERWFIPDFVEFQYGELKEVNRAHNSVINTLKKYNLLNKNKGLISPLQGIKEKDKLKDKEKDKEKEDVYRSFAHLSITVDEFKELEKSYRKNTIDEIIDRIENYKDNKKYSSLYLTAKNWLKKEPQRRKQL